MNFWKNKKILITGGKGFLGSHLVENLLYKRGVSLEQITIPRSEKCDLRVWNNCVKAVKDNDIVIHLAAKVGGIGYNMKYPATLFYDNAVMGIQLMEAARQEEVEKFVTVGTICAYPKYTPTPFKEEDIWNGYPEETNAPYGLAKKMLLVQSQAYRKQYNLNSIYLLPVNLYGPGDNFNVESSHVIPALINKVFEAKKNKCDQITIWGSGEATREFLYVKDAAEGIILATEKYNKPAPINLGSESEIKIAELARVITELADFKGKIILDKTKPDGQPRRVLNTTKALQEFGFKAKTNLKDGLKETIEWYKQHTTE